MGHHDHNGCCSEEGHSCCCGEESCQICHSHHHHQAEFSDQLLELADEAWMEVLKEKIKEKIKTSNGAQLDKLAALVSDANNARWKGKITNHKGLKEFKDKISEIF